MGNRGGGRCSSRGRSGGKVEVVEVVSGVVGVGRSTLFFYVAMWFWYLVLGFTGSGTDVRMCRLIDWGTWGLQLD